MTKIRITLPANRDFTGQLTVEASNGALLAGPFPICARSGDQLAADHGNPTRASTLPYGDTPLGRYRVLRVARTGDETHYRGDLYGTHGAIVLGAKSGDAALADANGRFEILIHGGALNAERQLRATSGGMRLADPHLRAVISAITIRDEVICECIGSERQSSARPIDLAPENEIAEFQEAEQSWVTPVNPAPIRAELVAQGEYGDQPVPAAPQAPATPTAQDTTPTDFDVSTSGQAVSGVPPPQGTDTSGSPPAASSGDGSDADNDDDHYTVKDNTVHLTDEAQQAASSIAKDYNAATGSDIVVTDGSRTPDNQAQRMYSKLVQGDNLAVYTNKQALQPIVDAYNSGTQAGLTPQQIQSNMTSVIQSQVDQGTYVSRHLQSGAFDVRMSDMTPQQQAAFRTAVQANGGTVVTEAIPPHFHVQFAR